MIAIIPCKANSERLPGKNTKLLAGKPMVMWTVEAAKNSNLFEHIVVSSDKSNLFSGLNISNHNNIILDLRKPELATDTATVFDVCRDILKRYKYDSFSLLLPTSPLRTSKDIENAYNKFEASNCGALMSVSEFEYPIDWALDNYNGFLCPAFSAGYKKKRQELIPLYKHDGSIIMCKTKPFLKASDWLDMKPIPWLTPLERSLDVNTEKDFKFAEFLLSRNSSTVEQCSCKA